MIEGYPHFRNQKVSTLRGFVRCKAGFRVRVLVRGLVTVLLRRLGESGDTTGLMAEGLLIIGAP